MLSLICNSLYWLSVIRFSMLWLDESSASSVRRYQSFQIPYQFFIASTTYSANRYYLMAHKDSQVKNIHSVKYQKGKVGSRQLGKDANIDLQTVVNEICDMADCSNSCDLNCRDLIAALSSCSERNNVTVIQRNIKELGVRYNIIEYHHNPSDERRIVIAIRGTKNVRNLIADLDTQLVYDDILDIKVHRGFKNVYRSILNDIVKDHQIWNLVKAYDSHKAKISIRITGHSLGGATACLLGKALVKQYGINVKHIVAFGVPKFTNTYGSSCISTELPLTIVEHVMDPIVSLNPFHLKFSFEPNEPYDFLRPHTLVTLQPQRDRISKEMHPDNMIRLKRQETELRSSSLIVRNNQIIPEEAKADRGKSFEGRFVPHVAHVGQGLRNIEENEVSLMNAGSKMEWHYMQSYVSVLQTLQH